MPAIFDCVNKRLLADVVALWCSNFDDATFLVGFRSYIMLLSILIYINNDKYIHYNIYIFISYEMVHSDIDGHAYATCSCDDWPHLVACYDSSLSDIYCIR